VEQYEKAYWISEVAELLGMNINTIRKYCLMLEEQGYCFKRDDQNRRAFLSNDIILIQEIVRKKQTEKMPLEDAIQSVISTIQPVTKEQNIMPSITQESAITLQLQKEFSRAFEQVSATLSDLRQEIQEQRRELQEQREYIERLEERRARETDALLGAWTERYRQLQEEREQQRKSKSWWKRFFG
jgi:DNA-binding transcriptional MerR regulator